MSNGKKVNPRRRPASEADMKRARDKATNEAIHLSIAIFLTVLKDKFDFDNESIQRAWREMDKLSEEVAEHRINLNDMVAVLRDEYDIDLKK